MFTTREYAIGIWLCALVVWILIQSKIRRAFISLIKALLARKLLIVQAFMVTYVVFTLYVLYWIGFWKVELLKDTVYWFLGTAFVMVMHHTEAYTDPRYFRSMAIRTLELGVLLGFVTDFYTLNLHVEMVLIPLFAFLGGLIAVAGTDVKYSLTKKFLDGILVILVLGMLLYAIGNAVDDAVNFVTITTLKGFLLPSILTISFLPFIYLLAIYSRYETLFVHIDVMVSKKSQDAAAYLKHRIVTLCLLNLKKLSAFTEQSRSRLWSVASMEDAACLIESFRNGTLAAENDLEETQV